MSEPVDCKLVRLEISCTVILPPTVIVLSDGGYLLLGTLV